MDKPLNKKQRGFVRDFIKTENGTQAVLNNYNTDNYSSASAMSVENLKKPHIQRAIVNLMDKTGLDDITLLTKHLDLLRKQEVIVRNNVTSGEIEVIPTGEIDSGSVAKGLDMAYKIKGHYVNEKRESDRPINVAFILNSYER